MKTRRWIIIGILIWLILIAGAFWANSMGLLPGFIGGGDPPEMDGFPPDQGGVMVDGEMMPDGMMPTQDSVPIQPATDFIPDVVASGRLELRELADLTAPVDVAILAVAVELGDVVDEGMKLVTVDTDQLSANLEQQMLDLSKARLSLANLFEESTQADLLSANAELLEARDALTKLQAGPDETDRNDALLQINEARAALTKLEQKNDPNSQTVREARFNLSEARNSLQTAKQSYEAIAWKGDLAASVEAEALKNATIRLERAQVAFDEASAPADSVELDSAKLAITRAQSNFDKLLVPPSVVDLEKARARISQAEQQIEKLNEGPTTLQIQEAETAVMNALNNIEQTREQLLKIEQLAAPMSGRIVNLSAKADQTISAGNVIATIAADKQFKIEVPINELSILNIHEGMDVEIVSDVMPDEELAGTVSRIAPTEVTQNENSSSSSIGPSLVTFPVIVELLESPLLQKLRAGMSAEVTFIGSNQLSPNSWLVPQNSLEDIAGDTGTIMLVRDQEPEPLEVTVTDQTQGEWQVVVSEELQAGDLVLGSTTSFLDEDPSDTFFGP